jgi:hypothetical protein
VYKIYKSNKLGGIMTQNRVWAKQFRGTAQEFIVQAKERDFTDRSIKYWVKFNWNINL